MVDSFYNIHHFVKFKITTPDSNTWMYDNILQYFKNFEVSPTDELDFTVTLGKFTPSNHNCIISEGKYYIKNDYFFCKQDSYKFATWSFELLNLEGPETEVKISSNFLGYLWMSGFIIEFLILYKLNHKGVSVIHASGVNHNNQAYLFSARGGGGKTSIAINFIEKGLDYLGDNFILIFNGGVYSYISPLNIFSYNLSSNLKRKFSFNKKIHILIKDLMYKMTFRTIKIFTKINPKKIFNEKIIERSHLHSIFILISKNQFQMRQISKDEACVHILYNQKLEMLLFLPYILELSYIFPGCELNRFWEKYMENLQKNLVQGTDFRLVEVPLKYEPQTFHNIYSEIVY